MRIRSLGSALVVLLLALAPAAARAEHHDFTYAPDPPNQGEPTTFTLQDPPDDAQIRWDLDGGDNFDDGEGPTATRTFETPGDYTVRVRVNASGPPHVSAETVTVNGAPSVDFDFSPTFPREDEDVAFTSSVTDPEDDAVTLAWDFGDGSVGSGASPTHPYASAGTYPVTVIATDEHGATGFSSETVTVSATPGPSAAFTYTPGNPLTGDLVTFTSTSTAGAGSITDLEWDLDNDGDFDDGTGPEVSRSFATAGTHVVLLRATQTDGKRSVAFSEVDVAQRPPPPATGGVTAPTGGSDPVVPTSPRPLVRMRPFPVVRIAGVVLPTGAEVRILSVRAPRGARVRVRCGGRGCPVSSIARTTTTRLVRFRQFERRLRAGIRITILVRQAGRIGKYTRFRIRAGRPPARVDRCLVPGRSRPVRCT